MNCCYILALTHDPSFLLNTAKGMTKDDLQRERKAIQANLRNDDTYWDDPISSEFCCMLIDVLLPTDLIFICICLCGTQFSRMLADLQNGGSICEGCNLADCASVANMMVLDDGYDSPIIVGSVVQNIIVWNIRWRCPLTGTLFQHCPTCSPKEGLIVLRRTTIFVKGCKNLRVDVHVFSQAGPKSMIYEHVLEPLSKAGIDGVSVDLDRHPHISSHNTRRPNMTVDAQCKKSTNALQRLEDTKIEARHRNAEKNGLGIEQLSNWKSVHDLGILSDQLIFATYDVKALQAVYPDGKATVEHLVESFVLRSKKYELDPIMEILDQLPAYSQEYVKKNLVKIARHHQIREDEVLIYHILSYLGKKGHQTVLKKYGLTASEFARMGGNASVKSSKHHWLTTAEAARGGNASVKSSKHHWLTTAEAARGAVMGGNASVKSSKHYWLTTADASHAGSVRHLRERRSEYNASKSTCWKSFHCLGIGDETCPKGVIHYHGDKTTVAKTTKICEDAIRQRQRHCSHCGLHIGWVEGPSMSDEQYRRDIESRVI